VACCAAEAFRWVHCCQQLCKLCRMNQIIDPDLAAGQCASPDRPGPAELGAGPDGYRPQRVLVGGGQLAPHWHSHCAAPASARYQSSDAADDEIRAGVWLTAARMNLLRTPKSLPGRSKGIPALSFQSWFEARQGEAAYTAMDRIPKAAVGRVSAVVSQLPGRCGPLPHTSAADRTGRGTFPLAPRYRGTG